MNRQEDRGDGRRGVGAGLRGHPRRRCRTSSSPTGGRWTSPVNSAGAPACAVEIGNDANLGAVAEHRFGVAQGVDDVVYVMVSDGVGAGLVLDGRLYEGAVGGAGELGHVTVVPGGYVCRCGNRGCLETVAGARALITALTLTHGGDTTPADIVRADRDGDERARRVLCDAGRAVGRALGPLCTVLDPALVVIGGDCWRARVSSTPSATSSRRRHGAASPRHPGTGGRARRTGRDARCRRARRAAHAAHLTPERTWGCRPASRSRPRDQSNSALYALSAGCPPRWA